MSLLIAEQDKKAELIFRGDYRLAKRLLKFWVSWVGGVIAAMFAMSLWKNEHMDWGHIVTMSVAGLIGGLIGLGIRRAKNHLGTKE
ncbi:hypothetical protein [Sediminibacillus albus]|uniref:Uncharacterized protein n=1 Tax=Sediminibacillus albus TaxID=407036 RepID=A0A1G8YCG4_9BACI|nr:hypothetical protein [Sediminibacillus albus]SDJ99740.1 hypothetical protein SAMN05216243_1500 [Sediminibacillus albus]